MFTSSGRSAAVILALLLVAADGVQGDPPQGSIVQREVDPDAGGEAPYSPTGEVGQVVAGDTCENIGGFDVTFQFSNRFRGNLYRIVKNGVFLHEVKMRLAFAGTANFWVSVYRKQSDGSYVEVDIDGASPAQGYILIGNAQGLGANAPAFYGTGPINNGQGVELTPGDYAIGFAWGGETISYGRHSSSYPQPMIVGSTLASISRDVFTGEPPLPSTLPSLAEFTGGAYSMQICFLNGAPKPAGSIVAWGCGGSLDYGQCNLPESNMSFVAVSAGRFHNLGLKADGSIVAWGCVGSTNYGQCNVPAPNTGFVEIAAGSVHSLGRKADGSIVAWGCGSPYDFGQCDVPNPNSDFVGIAAGFFWHSLGLKADGSIVAWGNNSDGALSVPAPNTSFVAVAAGGSHSIGLKADGSIVAWGEASSGQTNVPAPNTEFVAVAAGSSHSLGLKADGSIIGWGHNFYGQTNVPAPNSEFVAVAGGQGHSLGLKVDGSIVAWGHNEYGQTNVPAPNADFLAVDGGWYHGVGIRTATGKCCFEDGQGNMQCANLIESQCNAAGDPHLWEEGRFCGQDGIGCPLAACIDAAGSCMVNHQTPGCNNPYCCTEVCTSHGIVGAFCCDVAWDAACAALAEIDCRGSCCDTNGDDQGCTDNVTEDDCTGPDMVWTNEGECANQECNCIPDCNGATCGDDGCGGSCGTCDGDGNPCNGVENCGPNRTCVAGTPLNCNDGNLCNGLQTCDPASGCVPGNPLQCNDGNACNGVETCDPASGCVPGTPLICNNGLACDGIETCNLSSGCTAGTPVNCDDGQDCTVDSCTEPNGSCTHDDADCAIPTVSEWGLVVLALMLLIGAKVSFGRRQTIA